MREGTRFFLLSAGVPDPTLSLGAQAKKSPQCCDALVDTTCTIHPCFLEKRSSQVGSSLVLFPQGPARGVEV